jgi:hypothetical protein
MLLVLAGVAVAIAGSACPGRTERTAQETSVVRTEPGPPVTEGVTLTPTAIAMEESSATYEVPIAPPAAEEQRPVEAAPVENRPADSPKRCLMLQVSPSSASAYGIRGEVVQLVVRARNGCSTNFGSATFRVTAIGPDGREVGSAVGSFSAGIPLGGSAETLIAIPTKPSLALTYRAEVMGY